MPTYNYRCDDCSKSFEQYQKFSEDPLTVCQACGGTIRRVIGNVGVVFKGSGWYINDSRKKDDTSSKPAELAASKDDSTSKSTDSSEPAAQAKTPEGAKPESAKPEGSKKPTTAAAS